MDLYSSDAPSQLPAPLSLHTLSPSGAPSSLPSQSSSLSSPAPSPSPTSSSAPAPPFPSPSQEESRTAGPTSSRSVKHWPWRPNFYARLKIRGQILPVKLAQVTSTPPPDRPNDFGGDDWYDARFWACVYIDELDYCWWAFTVAIILLDEILRNSMHKNILAPATAEIKSLVDALRALRDAVLSDENYGGSRLWLPLSSGETLDEAISITHVCRPKGGGSFGEVFHHSRNPGFFNNGLNALINRAYSVCEGLHASSELFFFGSLPQEPMSRVEAYLNSGGQAFDTELRGLKFYRGILQLLTTKQGRHQYESPTLDRALNSGLVPDIVGNGAYGQISKVPHPYWGDLAVKEPLTLTEQNDLVETIRHLGMHGHSNILPIVAWAKHESRNVIAMQWAENGSLDDFLARSPNSSRLLLLLDVAKALEQLHRNKRIHGDLHMASGTFVNRHLLIPLQGNIVISKEEWAFLCDFGLSKEVDDKSTQDDAAGGTIIGGVPIYMAPELYVPGARRTFASEVFAFGMVVFYAYKGTRPSVLMADDEVADDDDDAAIITAIVQGTRPERGQVTRDDFSDEMWNLVQDCWKEDPAHRPSMHQIVTRMTDMVPFEDQLTFLSRAIPIELTLLRPGDAALDDAMRAHEKSTQLRWTLSRMERFGLKAFFIDHMEARDEILMDAVRAMLSGPGKLMDMTECPVEVVLRLAAILNNDS